MKEGGIHISLGAHTLGTLFGIPITNTLVTSLVVMVILISLGVLIGKRLLLVPRGLQNAFEAIVEYIIAIMEETLESRKLAVRYFPLIMTIFLFILFSNMFDFLPIFGSIGFQEGGELIPLFHPVNADLNSTLSLAIIAFLVIELSGIFMLGILKYGSKFVSIRSPMDFAIGLLEIIGNLARLISFSFRLFGSIFAGEVLILVVSTFVPYVVPVPIMLFEVLIGFLQAAIFALLTLAFIKIAIAEPHGAH